MTILLNKNRLLKSHLRSPQSTPPPTKLWPLKQSRTFLRSWVWALDSLLHSQWLLSSTIFSPWSKHSSLLRKTSRSSTTPLMLSHWFTRLSASWTASFLTVQIHSLVKLKSLAPKLSFQSVSYFRPKKLRRWPSLRKSSFLECLMSTKATSIVALGPKLSRSSIRWSPCLIMNYWTTS